MEPTTDTLVQTDEWTAQGSLDTVRSRLLAVAEDRGAKVLVADDAQLELRFGSRLAARDGALGAVAEGVAAHDDIEFPTGGAIRRLARRMGSDVIAT